MIVYLDNCMFNRPFDGQDNIRVRLETEAKLHIQSLIKKDKLSLVWSYILTYENAKNPFFERRFAIEQWEKLAKYHITANQSVVAYAESLLTVGVKAKDALHIACAVAAKADYFLTTDVKLLKKLKQDTTILSMNPTTFIQEVLHNDH